MRKKGPYTQAIYVTKIGQSGKRFRYLNPLVRLSEAGFVCFEGLAGYIHSRMSCT